MTPTSWATPVLERYRSLDRTSGGSPRSRVPVAAIVVVGALLLAAAATRPAFGQLPATVTADFGWSARQVLDGQVWRTATATVLTRDVFMLASLVLSTGCLLLVLERIAGRWVALSVWAAGAVWGYLGTTLLLAAGHGLGWDLASRTLDTVDYGPSAGTAAASAAVVLVMRQRSVTVVVIGALLAGSAWHHKVADVEHLVSFGTAVVLYPLVMRRPRRRRGGQPARPVATPP